MCGVKLVMVQGICEANAESLPELCARTMCYPFFIGVKYVIIIYQHGKQIKGYVFIHFHHDIVFPANYYILRIMSVIGK